MPSCLVHDEKDVALWTGTRKLMKIQRHHVRVHPRQEEREVITDDRTDRAIDVEVLVARKKGRNRDYATARPAPPDNGLKTKSPLIEKE